MKYKCLLLGFVICSTSALADSRHPNATRPELSAQDLASILGIKTVKGRLPNKEGFLISSYQIIFRDSKGREKPLSEPIEYKYDEYKKDDVGSLIVSLVPKNGAYELYVESANYTGSTHRRIPLKKKKYEMNLSLEFTGRTGNTLNDHHYVVPEGDSVIFSFSEGPINENTIPDRIIIRTVLKK